MEEIKETKEEKPETKKNLPEIIKDPGVKAYLKQHNETLISSCPVLKYTDPNWKSSERTLVITTGAVINYNGTTARRRIPMEKITGVTLSTVSN